MSITEITIRAIILDLGGDGIETRDLQDAITADISNAFIIMSVSVIGISVIPV